MKKTLFVTLFFLDLLRRNIECACSLARLFGAELNGKIMNYLRYTYVVTALEYFQAASTVGKHLGFRVRLNESKHVMVMIKDGPEKAYTPDYCPQGLFDVISRPIPSVKWDGKNRPRMVCFSSGIPFEQPQLRAITTPVFNVEPDGPYRMTSPEQTLYYTLFQSKIPSLYEMLALMRQLCLFTPKKKYWFKNPVCINLFKGAKKLFRAFYGICLDDRDVLVPMRKNGRPIPVALEDCPAFILADVLYAVLHTDPLLRYAERNRFAAVHYDDDGWVIDDGLRQKNIDAFIKDAFQILFLDLNCSKGHPELDLLVAKDLTYESWYPYIRHLADAEEIIIQDGVVLTGFLNDGCPALLYHGLRGYLPYFNAAMAGFIVMLLKGPLKYTLYGNAKYYSIRPEEFVNKKIQEVTTPLNGTMATHWTNYIRLDGAGILPPDSNVADPLKGKGFLDTVREQLLGLEYYFKVTWIDIDCLYLHFIRAFIDQYGVNGRIYVNELSLEDDDVSFALRFRKAHDLGSPGLAVAICKYDTDKDSLPRIEIEFERPIVYNDGTLGRFIFTAGEIRHRVEHIYKLLLKILDNPDKYSIADGVIHPIKVE